MHGRCQDPGTGKDIFVSHLPTVEVDQKEGQNGGNGSKENDPSLSVDISKVNQPAASTSGCSLAKTVVREEGGARVVAALEGRLELTGDIQLFRLDTRKEELPAERANNDSESDRKVVNGSADRVIAEERGELESAEEEDQGSSAETKNGAQQGNFHVLVVFIVFVNRVTLVVGIKVAKDTSGGKGVTDGVKDEDTDNQQGKDLVGEASAHTDDAGSVKEGSEEGKTHQPDRDPGIESQVRHVHAVGHVLDGTGKGNNGPGGSDHSDGHTSQESVGTSNPTGGENDFHGTNIVVGNFAVDGTESQSWCDDTDEHEEGDSHSLLVEVGHFLDPVSSNSALELLDNRTVVMIRIEGR